MVCAVEREDPYVEMRQTAWTNARMITSFVYSNFSVLEFNIDASTRLTRDDEEQDSCPASKNQAMPLALRTNSYGFIKLASNTDIKAVCMTIKRSRRHPNYQMQNNPKCNPREFCIGSLATFSTPPPVDINSEIYQDKNITR